MELINELQHFNYSPPVRFLRVAPNIGKPLLLVPIKTDAETEEDLQTLSDALTEKLKGKLIGLNFDFYPTYIHPPVNDIAEAKDFPKPQDALRYYKNLVRNGDDRALDVSLVADYTTSKRRLKYSNHALSHKHLHPLAKKQYKVLKVECKKLYDADGDYFNEAGFTYAPHHLTKRKLNSRLADSIDSVYRDHKYKAKADGVAAFIVVKEHTLTQEDRDRIIADLELTGGVSHELYTLFN